MLVLTIASDLAALGARSATERRLPRCATQCCGGAARSAAHHVSDWVLLQCWPVSHFDIDFLYVTMAILALMAAEERVSISKFNIFISSRVQLSIVDIVG